MSHSNDNVGLIGYCGIYCGSCHAHIGKIPNLAKDLRTELRKTKYAKFAKALSTYPMGNDFEYFEESYRVLGTMMRFRCQKGCRAGGGSKDCQIRHCCQRKEIDGCWECPEFEECGKLDVLFPVHGDAHLKNLRKIKRKGQEEFVKGKKSW